VSFEGSVAGEGRLSAPLGTSGRRLSVLWCLQPCFIHLGSKKLGQQCWIFRKCVRQSAVSFEGL
jgi:hypothetical protein